MKRQRRQKSSWFSRLLANFLVSGAVLVALSLGIASCARKDVSTLASYQPRLVLEEFFAGRSVAYGIFEDRFGNLRRQFRVNLSGTLDGNRLVLDEEFLYDDDERASRRWTIDRLESASDGTVTYTGRAADANAAAQAKLFASEMAIKVTNDALQLFGAKGYSRNTPIERIVRDARMFTIGGGTAQILRTVIATRILERKFPQTRDGYNRMDVRDGAPDLKAV